MSNAWDVPALPSFGDVDKEVLFAAVGRALSQWEYFEGVSWRVVLNPHQFSFADNTRNASI